MPLSPNVRGDHLLIPLLSRRIDAIPFPPKFPTPELLLDLGGLRAHGPRAQTLHRPDNLRGTIRRHGLNQKRDRVLIRPHLHKDDLLPLGDLQTRLPQDPIDMLAKHDLSILGRTDHMREQDRDSVTLVKIPAFAHSPQLPNQSERSKLRGIEPVEIKVAKIYSFEHNNELFGTKNEQCMRLK